MYEHKLFPQKLGWQGMYILDRCSIFLDKQRWVHKLCLIPWALLSFKNAWSCTSKSFFVFLFTDLWSFLNGILPFLVAILKGRLDIDKKTFHCCALYTTFVTREDGLWVSFFDWSSNIKKKSDLHYSRYNPLLRSLYFSFTRTEKSLVFVSTGHCSLFKFSLPFVVCFKPTLSCIKKERQ